MEMTGLQIIETVLNLGGIMSNDNTRAYFQFSEDVSDDGCESLTLKDAINIEAHMMVLGFDGALIGTEFNELDLKGIYFQIH